MVEIRHLKRFEFQFQIIQFGITSAIQFSRRSISASVIEYRSSDIEIALAKRKRMHSQLQCTIFMQPCRKTKWKIANSERQSKPLANACQRNETIKMPESGAA